MNTNQIIKQAQEELNIRPLTDRQKEIFNYFKSKGGFNLSKTSKHFGISTASVFDILQILVKKGFLVHLKGEKPAYMLPYGNHFSSSREEFINKIGGLVPRMSDNYTGEHSTYMSLLDNWEGISKLIGEYYDQAITQAVEKKEKEIKSELLPVLEKIKKALRSARADHELEMIDKLTK